MAILHFKITVRAVLPEIVPEVAVMVAVPAVTPVARPLLLTVATEGLGEFQVTDSVILRVDPSENVPVAVNCWLTPTGTVRLLGVTEGATRLPTDTLVNSGLSHAVSDKAKHPSKNLAKTNLI